MVTITLYAKQKKRHRCIEQTFGLCIIFLMVIIIMVFLVMLIPMVHIFYF